ncbi:MAG: SemiSWEET transporter [Vicinamibacterales bacterium]
MTPASLVGLSAGILTTVAFVPQVWRAWRTRSTGDLSLGMLVTFVAGLSLWVAYGVQLREAPIVVSNVVTLGLALALLALKLRHGTRAIAAPVDPVGPVDPSPCQPADTAVDLPTPPATEVR